jgi:hypothetical protein
VASSPSSAQSSTSSPSGSQSAAGTTTATTNGSGGPRHPVGTQQSESSVDFASETGCSGAGISGVGQSGVRSEAGGSGTSTPDEGEFDPSARSLLGRAEA